MTPRRIGLALEISWPLRRHLDVYAGILQHGREASAWTFEVDEFIQDRIQAAAGRRRPYDGLIARATPELAAAARRAGIPLVNTWFNSPVRDELPGVFPDFTEMGRLAAEHLAERGFRRFGCLRIRGDSAHELITSSFHRALAGIGCRCSCAHTRDSTVESPRSWSRFQETLSSWIGAWTPPIGILIADFATTARYVVSACLRREIKIPEDVALITTSNEPHVNMSPPPSLTSVATNYLHVGVRAARMLDLLMRRKTPKARHDFIRPEGINRRDSTDYFAMPDPVVAAAMRFIDRHLSKRIRVMDVAAGIGVSSRRKLERSFRSGSGRSIAAEIRRLRVLKAKRLLSETDLLVKQIAKESGFGDSIRLHEVFIRDVGMSPSAFRAGEIRPSS